MMCRKRNGAARQQEASCRRARAFCGQAGWNHLHLHHQPPATSRIHHTSCDFALEIPTFVCHFQESSEEVLRWQAEVLSLLTDMTGAAAETSEPFLFCRFLKFRQKWLAA